MNALVDVLNLFAADWCQAVWCTSWQAALLGLSLLAIVHFGRRWPSPVRYALLLLALAKFATPPTAPLRIGLFSQLPSLGVDQQLPDTSLISAPQMPVVPLEEPDVDDVSQSVGGQSSQPNVIGHADTATYISGFVEEHPPLHERQSASVARRPSLNLHACLVLVHGVGILAVTAWIATQLACLRRAVMHAEIVTQGALFDRYIAICQRLRLSRIPGLLVTDTGGSPMTFGIFRPAVLLPRELMVRLSDAEMDCVLAHELAHQVRGDLWVNWAQVILCAVWWFHPVVWMLNRALRIVREDCSDDLVVAGGFASTCVYCDALLNVATQHQRGNRLSLGLLMADARHPLARRFRRLMDQTMPHSEQLSVFSRILMSVMALVLLPGIHNPEAADPSLVGLTESEQSEMLVTTAIRITEKSDVNAVAHIEEPPVTAQRLADEWNRRRAKYGPIEITVAMKQETSPDHPSIRIRRAMMNASKADAKASDGKDDAHTDFIREEELWRILIDGKRCCITREIVSPKPQTWHTVDGGTQESDLISFTQLKDGTPYSSAFVRDTQFAPKPVPYWPIVYWSTGYRNVSPTINPSLLTIKEQRAVLDGEECVIAEYPEEWNEHRTLIWFAPRMDFSIVRYATLIRKQTHIQLDCRYERDPSGVWVPDNWTLNWFGGAEKPFSTSEMKVRSYDLQPDIHDSLFESIFPVGTVVTDVRYNDKGHTYVVGPDENQLKANQATITEFNSGKWAKDIGVSPNRKMVVPDVDNMAAGTTDLAKIELLGGRLKRDTTRPDQPVIGVSFGRDSRFRDRYLSYLVRLTDLTELSFSDPQVTDMSLRELANVKKLTTLTLYQPDLTVERLKLISSLHGLTSLSIIGGRIACGGLKELNALDHLRTLRIEQATLSGAYEDGVVGLNGPKELRELRLIGCGLMSGNLVHFSTFPNLTHLDLTDSRIRDESMQQLGKLTHLQQLLVQGAEFTDARATRLRDLSELTTLNLRRSPITDLGLMELAMLPGLTYLNLASTHITDDGLERLSEHRQLSQLDLSGCKITNEGLVHLKKLPHLTRLAVRNTSITAAGLNELQVHQGLTHLELAGPNITDAEIRTLPAFKNMRELLLRNTNMMDASVDDLIKLGGLTKLDLSSHKLTAAAVEKLRSALPATRIITGESVAVGDIER